MVVATMAAAEEEQLETPELSRDLHQNLLEVPDAQRGRNHPVFHLPPEAVYLVEAGAPPSAPTSVA